MQHDSCAGKMPCVRMSTGSNKEEGVVVQDSIEQQQQQLLVGQLMSCQSAL